MWSNKTPVAARAGWVYTTEARFRPFVQDAIVTVWPTKAITGDSFLGPAKELGRALIDQVLQGQLAFSSSGRWRGSARRASRRELSAALLNEDLLCGSPVRRCAFET